jgi:hypothetical protein
MYNKIDVPWLGENNVVYQRKTPFVMYVSAFTPRSRVPTVPEKQIDKMNPV